MGSADTVFVDYEPPILRGHTSVHVTRGSVRILGCVLNHPVTRSSRQHCSRLALCLLCVISSYHPRGFSKQVSSVHKEKERF